MNNVYVLGGAQTDFERNWSKEGKNVIALLREVVSDACYDVDITYAQIEQLNRENRVACFVGNFIAELFTDQGHLGALLTKLHKEFYGVPSSRYEAACASGSAALDAGISKIRSGDYDVAIVVGWELMKTVSAKVGGDYLGRAGYYASEGKGIDLPFPKLLGQLADAYVARYGEEERYMDALARLTAMGYENAKRNPNAQTRRWFMNEAQAKRRGTPTNALIGGRIAMSDCSHVTDGGAAVVLCSEKFLKENKIDRMCPVVKGFGHRTAPIEWTEKLIDSKDSDYILPWTRQAVLDAYARAGVSVNDIDFFEGDDSFSPSAYASISAFGLTPPGKEYEAVESGLIAFDGKKPMNPSGGLIGCGHPVGASGVRMFLDLYKQITGRAGGYQIPKADIGCMLNLGGSATSNYVFVMGKE